MASSSQHESDPRQAMIDTLDPAARHLRHLLDGTIPDPRAAYVGQLNEHWRSVRTTAVMPEPENHTQDHEDVRLDDSGDNVVRFVDEITLDEPFVHNASNVSLGDALRQIRERRAQRRKV